MRILAFTDTHGFKRYIKILNRKLKGIDLLVCAGDISDWGKDTEKQIREFEKFDRPMLLIHGNHESEDGLRRICKKYDFCYFLHKGSYQIGKYVFLGYGGGGFTERDSEFERLAEHFKASLKPGQKVILVTHGPPYGTAVDLIPGLGHRGCRSLRKFIKEVQPLLHICGHFHETFAETDTIGKTIILNPGPEGKIIDI